MKTSYKRAERINVYQTTADMHKGNPPVKTLMLKPITYAGYDYYKLGDGIARPAWRDQHDAKADGCICIEGPRSFLHKETAP